MLFRSEEGDKRAIWLHKVKNAPYETKHAIQIMTTFVSSIFGIYQIRLLAKMLMHSLSEEGPDAFLQILSYVAAAVLGIFLFAVLGVIAPQKVAARRPEKWLFTLAGPVHGMILLLKPYTVLAEAVSNLAVRIVGVDPNASIDDVTEEEIISMVHEGHVQGVLQASEAEMIHNIFEFDDKEAKDIMTHRDRKSVV